MQRLNYDAIAHLYDAQPYRAKTPDPELARFLAQVRSADVRALDLGCGTGNQQVANRAAHPEVTFVGADLFGGMLAQAAAKSRDISWVQCDGAELCFPDRSFDYVSSQFSLHHVREKARYFREVHRVLRPEGWFVLQNVCPEGMADRAVYRYFPETRALDARDYLSVADHLRMLEAAGFHGVVHALDVRSTRRSLQDFRAYVKRRDVTSELLAISDAAYATGLARIDSDLRQGTGEIDDAVCLLTVRATA